jgi:RNA polymerase-interacting CarD/CdnL/TRCF family regulator
MFKVGDKVSFGLHGKCIITAIENKEFSGNSMEFYQIKSIKNPLFPNAYQTDKAAHIYVPVQSAKEKGLRELLDAPKIPELFLIIKGKHETYFSLDANWIQTQKHIEESIRREGATGLAKALNHLYILKSKANNNSKEQEKLFDRVKKILIREIAETTEQLGATIEKEIDKTLRQNSLI